MKKINILGTECTIFIDADEKHMPEGADGCTDQSTKKIKVAAMELNRASLQNLDEYRKKVLRHEIIHAFLYESGIWNNSSSNEAWGCNEEITDWFAIQSPKILNAFLEAECI